MKYTSLVIIFIISIVHPIFNQTDLGIDAGKLIELRQTSQDTDADGILVVHRGEIIDEWYNSECDSVFMNTASLMKSITGVMLGVLVQEGLIKSENDLVCDYLPEWKAGCKHKVTIKHLLTMTSGLKKRRASTGPKRFIFAEKDFFSFLMEQTLDTLPGAIFSYSNEGVQLLAPIIERACGMEVEACFKKKLFEPLGMESTSLMKDPSGNAIVFGGAKTTLRDISRIGQLMLNKGCLNGKQLISEDWVSKSTSPIPQSNFYGYLWWIDAANNNFAAMGDFGQLCIIFPGKELIYTRYQTCSNTPGNNMGWMGPKFIQLIGSVIN